MKVDSGFNDLKCKLPRTSLLCLPQLMHKQYYLPNMKIVQLIRFSKIKLKSKFIYHVTLN